VAGIPFVREMDFTYGAVDQLAPGLRRVIAENPSKYTFHGSGTYIVGRGEVAVIDPGPDKDGHLTALLAAVEGEQVTHILVTHTHRDHSPLARRLAAETGAPIWGCGPHDPHDEWPHDPADDEEADEDGAAAEAADDEAADDEDGEEGTEGGFDADHVPDRRLEHGDVVDGSGWRMEVVHTPGHTSNHLCFATEEGALFSGDHVMGWSTSVIAPPDGDMAAYLASLRLLLDRPDHTYYPTHGPPITRPHAHVEAFVAHRIDREDAIVALLRAQGPSTIVEMVPTLYADVHERLHRPAARSVHSHLRDLLGRGIVEVDGDPRIRSEAIWTAS
jgi:glyoxylase-like metal-dependent hydrolase (beta-lactamase superfamily II)